MHYQPARRSLFMVAIICALAVEYDAVCLLADQIWDRDKSYYGKLKGDWNNYTTCRFGEHNVVIVLLSSTGKASSAGATTRLRMSFSGIQTVFLVGVCGGAPRGPQGDIFLGDVIIGDEVTPYDYGKRYPEIFKRAHSMGYGGVGDSRPRAQGPLTPMNIRLKRKELEERTRKHLDFLYQGSYQHDTKESILAYSRVPEDRLFEADYQHKHHRNSGHFCQVCDATPHAICDEAIKLSCQSLGCDIRRIIQRTKQRNELAVSTTTANATGSHYPKIHLGPFASADTVLKSATHRNELSKLYDAIGFEMEAAGLMNETRSIVVKGVSDYADSHKDKRWQPLAAAAAASVCKAVLEYLPQPALSSTSTLSIKRTRGLDAHEPIDALPYVRNEKFQGRQQTVSKLKESLFNHPGFRCVTLHGLGGIGKSQVALEVGHWAKNIYQDGDGRDCSVMWIPALSLAAFEDACAQIVTKIPHLRGSTKDPKIILKEYFSSESAGRWLIILDNADDCKLMFGDEENFSPSCSSSPSSSPPGLMSVLPESAIGSILITTRNRKIGLETDSNDVIGLAEMDNDEAKMLFMSTIIDKGILSDTKSLDSTMEILEGIPLAITQATAYINTTQISVDTYLRLLRNTSADDERLNMFRKQSRQGARYVGSQNSITATWLLSFNKITEVDPIAGGLLVFIACVEPKAIPHSMLPIAQSEEEHWHAIGTLLNYSFLSKRKEGLYDMHALVHTVIRQWTGPARLMEAKRSVLKHLADICPSDDHDFIRIRQAYFAHGMKAIDDRQEDQSHYCLRLKTWLGHCAELDGKTRLALSLLEPVVAVYEETFPEGDEDRLAAQHYLAISYDGYGAADKCIRLLEHVVEVRSKILPEANRLRLRAEQDLALMHKDKGRFEQAVALFEDLLARLKGKLEPGHPDLLNTQYKLASSYVSSGQLDQALPLLEDVVAIREKTLPRDDPDILVPQFELARAYGFKGEWDKSQTLLEPVLRIRKETLEADDPNLLITQFGLAVTHLQLGKVEDAIDLLENNVQQYHKIVDPDQMCLLMSQSYLATAYHFNGQMVQAIQLQEVVSHRFNKILTGRHSLRFQAENSLARSYLARGQVQDAMDLLLDTVIPRCHEHLSKEDPEYIQARTMLATAYLASGESQKALAQLEEVVSICENALGEGNKFRLNAQHQLARAYQANGQPKDAVRLLETVVEHRESLKPNHFDRLGSEYVLSLAYWANDQANDAVDMLKRVVTQRKLLALNHPDRIESEKTLADMFQSLDVGG